MSDQTDLPDTPGEDETDTGAGGTPDEVRELLDEETTDENGKPLENPSGG